MENEFKLAPNKISFLGAKESIKDIRQMNKYFKLFLLVGSIVILFFNFFSFDNIWGTHFVPMQQYYNALNKEGFTMIGHAGDEGQAIAIAVLYSFSGIAAISGLLAVAMIVEGKTSQFFWGLINSIFYGAFALVVGYVGDLWMNVILILGAPLGWYLFSFKNKEGLNLEEHKSLKFHIFFWTGIVVAIGLMVALWYFLIPGAHDVMFGHKEYSSEFDQNVITNGYYAAHDQTIHTFDAIVNGSNTVGYVLQLVNFSQQFYVWFFVDFFKLLKFTGIAPGTLEPTMIIQFGIWFTMDAIGIYKRVIKPMMLIK